jgi:hypothetical protein
MKKGFDILIETARHVGKKTYQVTGREIYNTMCRLQYQIEKKGSIENAVRYLSKKNSQGKILVKSK